MSTPQSYSFLIVEPSLAKRIVIRSQFLNFRHHLDIAWDFESAREYLSFTLYDLILIDINIHQRTILINQIQNNWRIGKKTPIIGISSHEDYALSEENKERVFRKPFTKKDVIKIIEFLNGSRKNH
ncbi:TPA: response regulator [Legionella pneumophila subsp. pneumophila]|jgi:two-component SAPR family response regulator|uniref:response regulator n=1 Tax=Legionella TaxID=445 RepID=UPI0007709129|nr:response regulator [Legionella sp. PC1000]MBN9229538.1 response regulator [Legionella sp.]MDW8855010.1 response regulator [Legionella pneumophila]HAT9067705.1 response regulator [Legionella pneumophila subsp. pneumophila]MDW8922286.1 response regulator [Legionella pneumophila]QLZ70825.1 response regulator [Legionella sp. PC1000]